MRYQIIGESLPVVICELESGERMITEGGGMDVSKHEDGDNNQRRNR